MPEHIAILLDGLRVWIDANRGLSVFAAGVFVQTLLIVLNANALVRAGREAAELRAAVDRLGDQLTQADARRRSKTDERRRILASLADGLEARPDRRD